MPRSVVIVDDHDDFRRLAGRLLAALGYDVVGEAADARGGLELTRRLRPQVLLLDVQLPDGNGFDVAAALRDEAVQVVLTSSRDATDFEAWLPAPGSCGFITKGELGPESLTALLGPAR